jgi:ADP-ribose pyrophosphatase YjhB (NUDIX family)
MQHLATHFHESIKEPSGIIVKRLAARGIIIKNGKILLIYTKRYNDYSLPGGGVDDHEDISEGLCRELKEETGAQNVAIIRPFGIYEEYRPALKETYDILHMMSYIYEVACDELFLEPKLESYEVKNGMKTIWMNIEEAIFHNQQVIDNMEPSGGLSIKRELFLLKEIKGKYF